MNDIVIVTIYSIIDEVMQKLEHKSHVLAKVSDAEILTVAVVAACYFRNHQERTLYVMIGMGYLSHHISISRFNRRIHALSDWLGLIVEQLGNVFAGGESFILDSMPLPVCKRARARRCRKVRGRDYCGWCAAKREKFFGWRLHLLCTPDGLPVSFAMLPAAYHDLTPVHELTAYLPEGAAVYTDKAYLSAPDQASILALTGVRLIAKPRHNMQPLSWADDFDLRLYRHSIETRNSQLENMGILSLHARTNAGFEIKLCASVLALACINLN
jgi:hypothetical protein